MEAKTKRNLIIWGVLLLVLLNVSSLGTIWYHRYQYKIDRSFRTNKPPGMNRTMRHKPPGADVIGRNLDLSANQQVQFDSIWQFYNDQRDSIESSLEINRSKMGRIMSSTSLDTAAYYQLSDLQLSLIGKLDKTMIEMNMALRGTLSEEQARLFLKKIESLNNRRNHDRPNTPMRKKRTK